MKGRRGARCSGPSRIGGTPVIPVEVEANAALSLTNRRYGDAGLPILRGSLTIRVSTLDGILGDFMRIVRSRFFQLGSFQFGGFQFGIALVTSLSFSSMLPTAANAYTADQQQACTGDAFQFCSAEIPDVDRVTACMIANKERLSPGCRAFFRPGPEPVAEGGEPLSIKPVTSHRRVGTKPHKAKKKPRTT
jgi:hypothetical protein